MQKISLILLAGIALAPRSPSAFPVSMDIGTFAIDSYSGNGGGGANLSYQVSLADNFYSRAFDIVPGFAGGNTGDPTHPMNLQNTSVTKAAVISTSNSLGSREYNDFVFYAGHGARAAPGLNPAMYLGGAIPPYGRVSPPDFTMGGSGRYNRWFMAHSCTLFPRFSLPSPAATWSPIFTGLKAMLAFESYVWDNWDGYWLFNEFWLDWTYNERTLFDSFVTAEINYGYAHLGGTGLLPGCLSASDADYCNETFRNTAHNYSAAGAGAGTYHSQVVGAPYYP